MRHRHARGAGVLLHVVQRLADHLQHFERHLLRQAHGRGGAHEGHRNPALLLKRFGGAARRRHQVAAIHVHRPHAVQEGAQVAHLGSAPAPAIACRSCMPALKSRSSSLRRISRRICRLMKLCSGPSWKSEAMRWRSSSRAFSAALLRLPSASSCRPFHLAPICGAHAARSRMPACPPPPPSFQVRAAIRNGSTAQKIAATPVITATSTAL